MLTFGVSISQLVMSDYTARVSAIVSHTHGRLQRDVA